MYRVINLQTGEEVLILHSYWSQRVAELRSLDRRDILVCPGCLQPVRTRTGKVKRWHFAHKHLQNCPFQRESPARLKSRAVLYSWLVRQFGEAAVTVEKQVDAVSLPQPIDGWVEQGTGSLAYWIIDARMPPQEREDLLCSMEQVQAQIHWVFVAEMLREDEKRLDHLYLTTTERAFMQSTVFDEAYQGRSLTPGKTLHYLDPDQEVLTTFRGLRLVHAPQLFAGLKYRRLLVEVQAEALSGEFVHPGELTRLRKYQKTREVRIRREAEVKKQSDTLFSRKNRISALEIPKPVTGLEETSHPPVVNQPFARQATCRICGKQTADWVTYFGQTNECICRDCKDKA